MRLENIVEKAKDFLKDGELNLREKTNIYAGAILGLLGPIVATRYLCFGFSSEKTLGEEALKWISSLVLAPSLAIGLPSGIFLGYRSAKSLKSAREEEERHEKALVKKVLYI